MTIRELYNEAMKYKSDSLMLLIEWFVYEAGLSWECDSRNILYICEKYGCV